MDYAVLEMAKSLLNNNQQGEAINELINIQGSKGYINSKSFLANIYFSNREYDKVIVLLAPLQTKIGLYESLLLGYSYSRTNQFEKCINTLDPLLRNLEKDRNKKNLVNTYVYLGEANYKTQQYFKSAEYFYLGFSRAMMYQVEFSDETLDLYLPIYIASIKIVADKNSSDYRTYIWSFVYYLYTRQQAMANQSLDKFTEQNTQYDKEFMEWLLAEIKKTKQ